MHLRVSEGLLQVGLVLAVGGDQALHCGVVLLGDGPCKHRFAQSVDDDLRRKGVGIGTCVKLGNIIIELRKKVLRGLSPSG